MTKKRRRNREPEFNNHHILPASLGGSNEPPNLERWKKTFHDKLHAVFENDHTLEKIARIYEQDKAILTERAKRAIEEIINMSPQDFYLLAAFTNKHAWKVLE